jgi:ribosome-associated toxin RatA of RatAB toxin-antitoxin module
MVENPGKGITWSFESGDLFKVSNGSWQLEPLENGKKTKATYSVEAQFKLFIPGKITKALASVNLPNMMRAYHQKVENLKK